MDIESANDKHNAKPNIENFEIMKRFVLPQALKVEIDKKNIYALHKESLTKYNLDLDKEKS